jgi:hypothetical protein
MGREGVVVDPTIAVTTLCQECFNPIHSLMPVFIVAGDRDEAHLVLTGVVADCAGEPGHTWTMDPATLNAGFVIQ